jgi:triosephosphate isomerase (TIM)
MIKNDRMNTMRAKIIAANWKMNMDYPAGLALFSDMIAMIHSEVTGAQQTVVCCPFIHLHALAQLAGGCAAVSVGAENCHEAESGAFTGETSAGMIRSTGADYVIIGHSERRKYAGETSALVCKKTEIAMSHSLKPIVCIGETKEERAANLQFEILERQLDESVFPLDNHRFSRIVIAYEPIWAIGTGQTASAAQAQQVHQFIRQQIAARYGQETANNTTLLYGGSCKPGNAAELFSQTDIDGGLIGGASLKAREFVDIVKVYN